MRRYLLFLAALIALLGSLSAYAATRHSMSVQLRGYVDATRSATLPYRVPRLGVNADLFQYDAQQLPQHLSWMQDAGITWVRQFAHWDQIEPVQGAYDWQHWDALLEALRDYPDLRIVVVFMHSPDWARTSEERTAPPDDPAHFARFAAAFAQRYSEDVDHYQIWDEPNLDDAWGLQDPRPAEYAALLAETYPAIHSVDADATVITAAFAPTTETSGQNIADMLYLDALYGLGAGTYFDAAAAKPYGFNRPPEDRTVNIDTLNVSRIIALREVMVAHGDGNKALWASNWGWNSLPPDWAGQPSIWGSVTQQQQIDDTLAALQRAEREWPWLGGMILEHWQPRAAPDSPRWGFALIDQQDNPTPLYEAIANRATPELATNGLYHPRTPYARYSGVWTFGELGADIGWLETTDSQLEFRFAGTDIALLLREGDYFAFLYPTIDGEPANATPKDADGNAYVLLRSATLNRMMNLVPLARGLSLEPHTLHVIPDRGWDRWALAGYAVSSGNLAQPYEQQLQAAMLTIAITAVAFLATAWNLPWQQLGRPLNVVKALNAPAQFGISIVTSLALMIGMLLTFGSAEPSLFRRSGALPPLIATILTGGVLVLEPHVLLVIASLLILALLIFHRIELGLGLVLLYTPFFLFPVELYSFAFPMSELLLLVTAAVWVLRWLIRWGRERQSHNSQFARRPALRLRGFDALLLLLLLLGALSLLWAEHRGAALTELRTLFIEPLLFYAILRTSVHDTKTLRRLVDALLLSVALVAIIGLVLYLRGDAIITAEQGVRRLASVYGSPNNVGLIIGRTMPFALAFALFAHGRMQRILYTLLTLLLLGTVTLTQSIGALLLGVPVGIGAVVVLRWGKRTLLPLLGLGVVALLAVFLLAQVSPRFANLLDWTTGTNFIRLRVWESSLAMVQDHPLLGLGLDQFLYAYRGEYIRPDAIIDPDLSHPHNILLDFWLRLGIAGVILLIGLQFRFWRVIITQARKPFANEEFCPLLVGAVGSMAALLAHGLVDNSIFVHDLVYVFMLTMGIAAAAENMGAIDERHDVMM